MLLYVKMFKNILIKIPIRLYKKKKKSEKMKMNDLVTL